MLSLFGDATVVAVDVPVATGGAPNAAGAEDLGLPNRLSMARV